MSSRAEVAIQLRQITEQYDRSRRSFSIWWRRARETWRVFAINRMAVFGVLLILVYALMSIAHPLLMSTIWTKTIYDPHVGYDLQIFSHPSLPSPGHLLGTDTLGRDVLSRLLAATTPTFILALTAALSTALISTLSGAFAVYFGGFLEIFLSHISDLFLLAPAPLVMVVIGGTVDISPWMFGLLYGLIAGLGGGAIVMRSQALTIIHKPYIEASRVAGAGGMQVAFGHLIPNMLPQAAVQMLVSVTGAVFADGFSTFLGLSRTRLNWGSMIYDSFTYQAVNAAITWNVLIPSALAISLFATAFYLIARGIHEVAEPRLRGSSGRLHPAKRTADPKPARPARKLASPQPASLEDTAPVWVMAGAPVKPARPEAAAWRQYVAARRAWQSGKPALAATRYTALIRSQDLLVEIVADLHQALLQHPNEVCLWQALGDTELRLGNPQRAMDAYRQAQQLLNTQS